MCRKEVKPKVKSAEQALTSLMALCARAERSSGDARRLMMRWGVASPEIDGVLQRLVRERFIDDSRYAQLYVREKVNINGWGARKISAELYRKGVARETIEQALQGADSELMSERLTERLSRKLSQIKGGSHYEVKSKLLRYAASQGYEYGAAVDIIDKLVIKKEENWDEF